MKKIAVHLTTSPDCSRLVGELAEVDRKIYFEYDPGFLQNPLWLSPFKLPPNTGLIEHRDLSFGPLFGLFDDSLPDGWGRLLMDRHFRKKAISPESLSPLDRLAYMGTRTMGALTYHPPVLDQEQGDSALNLHHLSDESYRIIEGTSDDVLPQLLLAGGSPGGARPKVLVGIRDGQMIAGTEDLPADYDAWMVKFPAKRDAVEEGRIEVAYSNMARAAGLVFPETRLLQTAEGDAFFGVKRFDRNQGQRTHVHTFGNMIHSNFRIPGSDYETLLKVTRILTKNQTEVVGAFRQMVFNIFAHNRDDHVKNFAFMLSDSGEWKLTPSYDLTFTHGPGGEHTMTVGGEGRDPKVSHILRVAEVGGISQKQANHIIEEVRDAISGWCRFAEAVEVAPKMVSEIQRTMNRVDPK